MRVITYPYITLSLIILVKWYHVYFNSIRSVPSRSISSQIWCMHCVKVNVMKSIANQVSSASLSTAKIYSNNYAATSVRLSIRLWMELCPLCIFKNTHWIGLIFIYLMK